LYGAGRIGDFVVNRIYRPAYQGWAVILLSAAVLTLGGCGRKGGLDLPPNAASQSDTKAAAQINPDAEKAAQPSVFNPSYGADAAPTAGRGPKRAFVLDPLLNSN
jgi:predicted small lipoprotein YifL